MVTIWAVGTGVMCALALAFLLPHNKYMAWATVALLVIIAVLNVAGR
ncbi:hypothetical protein [Burkholderia ubonensis]|nr:hypothetical protein [Burkholderia ubonensis]